MIDIQRYGKKTIVVLSNFALKIVTFLVFIWQINNNTKRNHHCPSHYINKKFNISILWQTSTIRKETIVVLSMLAMKTFTILVIISQTINNTKGNHCCHINVSTEYLNILVFMWQK
jgi:hypothetical protein